MTLPPIAAAAWRLCWESQTAPETTAPHARPRQAASKTTAARKAGLSPTLQKYPTTERTTLLWSHYFHFSRSNARIPTSCFIAVPITGRTSSLRHVCLPLWPLRETLTDQCSGDKENNQKDSLHSSEQGRGLRGCYSPKKGDLLENLHAGDKDVEIENKAGTDAINLASHTFEAPRIISVGRKRKKRRGNDSKSLRRRESEKGKEQKSSQRSGCSGQKKYARPAVSSCAR